MNDILNPGALSNKMDAHLRRVLSYIHLRLKREFNSLNEAFGIFDRSQDGVINIFDFKDVLLQVVENLYPNDAQAAFRALDTQNHGSLTKEDFAALYQLQPIQSL